MIRVIMHELILMVPVAIALLLYASGVFIAILITRFLTIRHYLKYHMDEYVKDILDQRDRMIEALIAEKEQLSNKARLSAVRLKAIEKALGIK